MGRPLGWAWVGLAAATAAWVTVDVLLRGPWTRLDREVSRTVLSWGLRHTAWTHDLLYVLSQFGGRVTLAVGIGTYVVVLGWLRRTWQPPLRFLAALAMLAAIIYAFKFGIGRTAPAVDRLHAGGTSYPSGHVPNAVLMWGLAAWLAAEYELAGWLRRLLDVLRFAGPVFAGIGMLLLDYHWLSDLVAGAAFGIVLLRLLRAIFERPVGDGGADAGERRPGAGRGTLAGPPLASGDGVPHHVG